MSLCDETSKLFRNEKVIEEKEMLVDKFRKLGFIIDQNVEIRESDQFGKHICATKMIEKGNFDNSKNE